MTTEAAATPYNLTVGYEQLDGTPNGSASEALTLVHAQLHIMLTDSRVDSDQQNVFHIWGRDIATGIYL
jgi:hypothetical protein